MHQVPQVLQLLTDARIGALVSAPKPVFIVSSKGELLLSNQAGLALLRVGSHAEAKTAMAAERGPISAAARALLEGAANGAPQLHPLPLPIRGMRRTVEFACSVIELFDGKAILLAGTEPTLAPLPEPAFGAAAMLDGTEDPLALFNGDGRRIHANPAASALIGSANSLSEFIPGAHSALARARADGSAELAFGVLQVLLRRMTTSGAPAVLAAFFGPSRSGEPAPTFSAKAAVQSPPPAEAASPRPAATVETAAPAPTAPAPPASGDQELATLMKQSGAESEPAANRFFWQSDEEGLLTSASPELAAAVGEERAAIVGLHWGHASARLGIDGGHAISLAMATQETWSGVTVTWPVDEDRVRAVELAAVPQFDQQRRFLGYRGFGVIREPASRSGSRGREQSGDSDSEQEGDSRAESPRIPPDPTAASESAPASAAPPMAEPASQHADGPVEPVSPLPPFETQANVMRLYTTSAASEHQNSLTAGERSAFREIAKVIGARMKRMEGGEPGQTVSAPANDAAPAAAELPPKREPVSLPELVPPVPNVERGLLERLPLGIVVHRRERVLYANRTLLDWIGLNSAEELTQAGGLGRLFSNVPSLTIDENGEAMRTITLSGRFGQPIPMQARLLSTPWEGESALVYVLHRADTAIDARIERNESALREAESTARELRAILDTATDGVALLDRNGRILGMNRSAEALFGFDAGEIEGHPFSTLFAPESHRAALDYLDGIAENGVASVLNDGREVIGRVREGGLIPLFMTIGRVSENGSKFCAVFRDITQWKRAEEELIHARRQAERESSAKSEFLAKVSHEIRTPLNAILGFSEVMMEERFGQIGNERYLAYLKDIHASGKHLISLINDLLDLSKIEAGRLELAFDSVDINEIASQCMAIMQPEANRERIIIRTALMHMLPPVVADARSIRQIVLNLLSNSIKFTQPGGQVIVSTTLTEDGELHLRVRDTGIGMSEAEIKTALEPFRQIATSGRRKTGGTGLGLPLTKALVEANRASFTIESSANGGTLIDVAFPSTRVLAE